MQLRYDCDFEKYNCCWVCAIVLYHVYHTFLIIQLIYTMDITADTIKKVAAEASILSSIRHKNIVNILGVSVLPPR